MTLNKKRFFRQKSYAVYTLIFFDFKVIKHVINIFLLPQKKNQINICFSYITFLKNFFKLKIDFKPLDAKVDIGCIVATCFFRLF
jgi:hypothetical protein